MDFQMKPWGYKCNIPRFFILLKVEYNSRLNWLSQVQLKILIQASRKAIARFAYEICHQAISKSGSTNRKKKYKNTSSAIFLDILSRMKS